MSIIDRFLNQTNMYRLAWYYLGGLLGIATILSFWGVLPYNGFSLVVSTAVLLGSSWLVNKLFAWAFDAPFHPESAYITALILALIITPPTKASDLWFLFWAAVWAMVSKFLFSFGKQNLFNPAAFAVMLTAFTINQSATWWIGNLPMLGFVLLGGLLIIRKLERADVFVSFLVAALSTSAIFGLIRSTSIVDSLHHVVVLSPLIFFASIMLTEPATLPPRRNLRILYGLLVGILFVPQVHIGNFYFTPELALLTGNLFFYLLTPRQRYELILQKINRITPTVSDFIFQTSQPLAFASGQYFEWTLPHTQPDNRGLRRYFTVASSPTESTVHLGVKFYQPASSYKQALGTLRPGDKIVASQLAGDFTLPSDPKQKCVFIAGGIGVTPFRSMIKYLLDTNQRRDITLFYSNQVEEEIAYKDIFDQAAQLIGLKTVYALTDESKIAPDWTGKRGMITPEMIKLEVPDYRERLYYLSGPHGMVTAFVASLQQIGVPPYQIKTDYFPGFV